MTVARSDSAAERILLRGRVQGVGMRPHIVRTASELGITGFVRNIPDAVEIHAEGSCDRTELLVARLLDKPPASAVIQSLERCSVPSRSCGSFRIAVSLGESSAVTDVPADYALCARCREEILNEDSRRFQYAFNGCTDCGPRYSLVDRMPFDRACTAMSDFEMCRACAAEYEDPGDRRFHCQVNSCPDCGPVLRFESDSDDTVLNGMAAVRAAATAVLNGKIVLVKGIGAWQLVCDARSESAVRKLRSVKRRPAKPMAVMVRDEAEAGHFGLLNRTATAALSGPENPIVIVPMRSRSSMTAVATAAGPGDIGLFLPPTALHVLLLQEVGGPCVVTSANRADDPSVGADSDPLLLSGMADCRLSHNRRILRVADDSVVRVIGDSVVPIRCARGTAPLSLTAAEELPHILAVGGHQKVAVALSNGRQAVLGPHIGNMHTVAARERFVAHTDSLRNLYRCDPQVIAHDLHPDYFTTQWAQTSGIPTEAVQHHHAHVAAGMLQHGWLDREVMGIAFDGTGFGSDGTLWGGELLRCTASDFVRVARLRPFALPGGERAVEQPWRIAEELIRVAQGPSSVRDSCSALFPQSSGLGRLLDGIASLLLGIREVSFEAEAAMRLESACDPQSSGSYHIPVRPTEDGLPDELDWRPMLREILDDRGSGVSVSQIAMKLMRAVAAAVATVCASFAELPVVLTGGCFQSSVLTLAVCRALQQHSAPIGMPVGIPPNDAGLAAGQLAVAAARYEVSSMPAGTD